jgi:UDP-N-acetylglucosamine 2-epimerase
VLTVLSIIGTRPEAIKMAPVIRELRQSDRVRSLVCVTGQHRQMLDQALELFSIRADCDLDLMMPDQTLSELTARLLQGLDSVIRDTKPDWVLAQGDTTTVMVAALVSFYHHVPFGHVEAGLRTGNRHSPFPEEANRCIADRLADLYFAPTARSRQALLDEGVSDAQVRVTGNTVIDALLDVAARDYDWSAGPLRGIPEHGPLLLVTTHRRENFGVMDEIGAAVRDLAECMRGMGGHVICPVHLNPNVRRPVREALEGLPNVSLIEPLDYLSMVHLMNRATLILTDSGGIQEEAPSLGVPVLVMRDTTERPEGVEAGVVRLVGTDRRRIVQEAEHLLTDADARAAMAQRTNPYGDGRAAERIVAALLEEENV